VLLHWPGRAGGAVSCYGGMSESDTTAERGDAVAEVLERLRAGVRQRQAELAGLDQQSGDLPASLAAVRRDAVLEEPSFRIEGAGAVRNFLERAVYVLFARRQHRALLRQQNRFNRSVELALVDLHAREEALGRELRRMAERLAEVETGTGAEAGPRQDGDRFAPGGPLQRGDHDPEPGATAPRAVGRGVGPA
jgi:hypothetical protein